MLISVHELKRTACQKHHFDNLLILKVYLRHEDSTWKPQTTKVITPYQNGQCWKPCWPYCTSCYLSQPTSRVCSGWWPSDTERCWADRGSAGLACPCGTWSAETPGIPLLLPPRARLPWPPPLWLAHHSDTSVFWVVQLSEVLVHPAGNMSKSNIIITNLIKQMSEMSEGF